VAGRPLLALASQIEKGVVTPTGLREIDPSTGHVVGLEYWHASTASHASC
jgi:hypothetical protein